MNAVRSNNVSLKYQRFTSSGYKVIGFTKIEFVAKSQFLSEKAGTQHAAIEFSERCQFRTYAISKI